jgi:deoxyinosine 3'endonuclease (endonuclease V)
MIVAFDTYYYEGFSYTVAGVFEDWSSEKVSYFVCSRRKGIDAEYTPGELYKRELPCIMQCLEKINVDSISCMIVDGFVWLTNENRERVPGLGKRLQDAVMEKYQHFVTVVGIAKNPYRSTIPECVEVTRGMSSNKPLYVTCTELFFTQSYADDVKKMFGEFRIPNIIKAIDTKTRNYCNEVNDDETPVDPEKIDHFMSEVKSKGFEYEGVT